MSGLSKDSTLNKLILLFIFDKMEMPLSDNTIIDLCQNKNNWIEYVDCKLALEQLIEANFVCKVTLGMDVMYNITVEGRVCLAHFFVRIPSSIREMISNYVRTSKMTYRRRQEYKSTYEKRDDGTYDVRLQIVESLNIVFEIYVNVANRATAKLIDKNWGEKAPDVYSKTFDSLIDQQ